MTPAEVQQRLDRLFDRFERMTDAELVLLRTVWEDQDGRAREEAWTMVKYAIRRQRRQDMLDRARDRVAAWVNNYAPPMVIGDVPASYSGSGMHPGAIRKAAIPPMLDAIAATIAGDELSADDMTVLLEPITSLAEPRRRHDR